MAQRQNQFLQHCKASQESQYKQVMQSVACHFRGYKMSSISQTCLIHAADKSPTFYMGEKKRQKRGRETKQQSAILTHNLKAGVGRKKMKT